MSRKTPKNSKMLKWLSLKAALLLILIAIPICVVASVDNTGDSEGNEQEIVINTSSISGKIWDDANGDGAYNQDEEPIANCLVNLYEEGNTHDAVQTTATDEDGQYFLADIGPGNYVVGVRSAGLDETEYAAPTTRVGSDNKFVNPNENQEGMFAVSEPMEIGVNTRRTDVDAGLRRITDLSPASEDSSANLVDDRLSKDMGVNTADDLAANDMGAHAADDLLAQDFGTNTVDNLLPLDSGAQTEDEPLHKDSDTNTLDGVLPNYRDENEDDNSLPKDLGGNKEDDIPRLDLGPNTPDDPLLPDLGPNTPDDPLLPDLGASTPDDPLLLDLEPNMPDDPRLLETDANTADDLPPVYQESELNMLGEQPAFANAEMDDGHDDDAYANQISGKLWHDSNGNGIYAVTDLSVRDYTVYLYHEDNTQDYVKSAQTDVDGNYAFTNIQPGSYVVGIKADFKDGIQYFVPTVGITLDNKFTYPNVETDGTFACTEPIEIGADTVISGIDAAIQTAYDQHMQSASGDAIETDTGSAYDATGIYANRIPGGRSPIDRTGETLDAEKNAYLNDASTAANGESSEPVNVVPGDKVTYKITVEKPEFIEYGEQYDVLFVLDWSGSMERLMSTFGSASVYSRDLAYEMSNYIFENYPHSRIAMLGHNAIKNCYNNPAHLNIQYDTKFVGKPEYQSIIDNSFKENYPNIHDDHGTALRAAIDKMSGDGTVVYGGQVSGDPREEDQHQNRQVIARDEDELKAGRIPIIVYVSDFQVKEEHDLDYNLSKEYYWSAVLQRASDKYHSLHPEGIMITVRLDHAVNAGILYSSVTYDGYMETHLSPAGHENWSFIKIAQSVSPANAFEALKDVFTASAPAPKKVTVTDVIPEGMTILSTNLKGTEDDSTNPDGTEDDATNLDATIDGQKVTWDLTGLPADTYTLEVVVEVDAPSDHASKDYQNKATVLVENEPDYETNMTYHRYDEYTEVTLSKTVTGTYAEAKKDFAFSIYFADAQGKALPEDTQFTYTGHAIPGVVAPQNDTLKLDGEGKAIIELRHGQSITIQDVKIGSQVRIIENGNGGYVTTYLDSKKEGTQDSNDTDFEVVPRGGRSFDFTNEKKTPPPTGISTGGMKVPMLLMLLPLLIFGGVAMTGKTIFRYRRTE